MLGNRRCTCAIICLFLLTLTVSSAAARQPLEAVSSVNLPALILEDVRAEDDLRESEGLPPRFAVPHETLLVPALDGTWEDLDENTRLWRLHITSPGALSLNLGFTRYMMPPGGKLFIYAADGSYRLQTYSDADNEAHGELWTPVVLSDDIVVEVTLARDLVDQLELELTAINVGYRYFGEILADKSGSCNIDVVCPEGDGWRDQIKSVGVISTGGSTFCTGFMVNNTAQDGTPYFMTANHCGINSGNAASLVVYWNFESPTCGQQGGGSLAQNQTGSYFRATYSTSDFTLVELDELPDEAFDVVYAGWDRSTSNPTSAVAIHHPSTDEKSISFEYDACTTTSYLGTSTPGDGTHIRVIDWDLGTTEPGSSGSPLFDQNQRVVGQLHGGYAACGNDSSDWYGRFSRSWSGGGTSSTRLSDWLDPLSTGQTALDAYGGTPLTGMKVTPSTGFASEGPNGGPFAPASIVYTVENLGTTGFNYSVSKTAGWLTLTNATGYLGGGASQLVTASINATADGLPNGDYSDTLMFQNLADGDGDTTRDVSLTVGTPTLIYSFPMDTDPSWTTQGQWAFGQPTGDGGEYGSSDPTSGYTGLYVYGYNLAGDYANNLGQEHLTTTAIDCTDLSQVTLRFRRYLGVERPAYDHAYLAVSTNGTTFTTVWENSDYVEDSTWQLVEYDISAQADGAPNLYIRWTMGTTDGSWRYCGWNIDDVEIWGVQAQSGYALGDINCDGLLNNGDIDAFLLAITDPGVYGVTYPGCDINLADCNQDSLLNNADIDAFVALLSK